MIIGISSIGVIGGIFEHCLFGVHDEFLITILPIPRVDLSHLDEQPPFRINTFPHVSTFGGRLKSFTLGKKNHVVWKRYNSRIYITWSTHERNVKGFSGR